jgi:hypothetical protein
MHDVTKNHTNKHADSVCGATLEKIHSKLDALQNQNFEKRRGKKEIMLPGGHFSKADRLLRNATYHQAEVKLGEKAFQNSIVNKDVECDHVAFNDDQQENESDDDGWASTSSSEDASANDMEDERSDCASDSS